MEKIYFVTSNEKKFNEISCIISDCDCKSQWDVCFFPASLAELQENSSKKLIKNKALEAFKLLKRPVLVEHTILKVDAFNELPGLHTNYFYSKLGYKSIIDYCSFKEIFSASVESVFCLCDGKQYFIGTGEEKGEIEKNIDNIRETDGFGWDVFFIPNENNPKKETYARMQEEKNKRSMRKKAWEDLQKNYAIWQQNQLAQISDTPDDLEKLARLIAEKKVMLFVGAGISASLGFPSWDKLIEDMGKDLGYEPELFKSYGDYMVLAEYAGLDKQNEQYQMLNNKLQITEDMKKELFSSEIYQIIEKLDFPIIYTTNYDSLIEEYYDYKQKEISVVKQVEDMKRLKHNVPRIMKFHGDLSEQNSIVLGESQYFERMNFQSFMDIQLQADMLQYPILFLGYSLSDINVKLLMYLAGKRGIEHNRAIRAYIYTATPNYVQKEVFRKNGIITYSGEQADKKEGTLEFLRALLKKTEEMIDTDVVYDKKGVKKK